MRQKVFLNEISLTSFPLHDVAVMLPFLHRISVSVSVSVCMLCFCLRPRSLCLCRCPCPCLCLSRGERMCIHAQSHTQICEHAGPSEERVDESKNWRMTPLLPKTGVPVDKTGVTVDRDKTEFRLYNSDSTLPLFFLF